MKLRIEPAKGLATQGTKVYLDGLELTSITGITLEAKAGDVWRCTMDMNVEVEGLQADVTALACKSRVYRKASRWELVKAFLGMP